VFGDLELVHALGRAGIACVSFSPPDSKVRMSRFVRRALDAPPPGLIDPADRALADAMLDVARTSPAPPVVFWDSDQALDFLSTNRARLEPELRFVIPQPELLRDLVDKSRFQALGERLGLPVPRAQVVHADSPDVPDLRFPVVLKPYPHRDARWAAIAGSEKALCVADRAQFSAVSAALERQGIAVLAQELVPGGEQRVVSYHVYVDPGGAVAGEFTGRKIRTFPPQRGMSTALVTTDDPAVTAMGREVVRRLDLVGVAKLDFKRAADGTLHLLEVNPRFTLWVHAGAVAGVNLPALVYADLTGTPRPVPTRARPGVRWVGLKHDAAAARAAGVPLARWVVWALGCETNSGFSWSDPGPLLGRLASPRSRLRRRPAGFGCATR
jgi:D-aspartate ligase